MSPLHYKSGFSAVDSSQVRQAPSAGLSGWLPNNYFQLELIEKRAELGQAENLSGEL